MAYLVRKISRAKWPEQICKVTDIMADAISDIRTSGNTLSVWKIDSLEQLDEAALALAVSSKTSKIEKMDIVWIDEECFHSKGISIVEADGDTAVGDLIKTHRDLCGLNYKLLGDIAEIIIGELLHNKNYKRYTKNSVQKALCNAYRNRRIEEEKCTPELLKEIREQTLKADAN